MWEQTGEGAALEGAWESRREVADYFEPPPPKPPKRKVEGRADDTVYYDFYAEMQVKKLRPMYNPNDSMIVLAEDRERKDERLLRTLKSAVVWFLQDGP